MQIFTTALPRQLVRAASPSVWLRSFSCSARALQPASDKTASRVFLSSPFSETDDSERRYIQARTTVITPTQQADKGDDFQAEHMHDKLKKVELCKRYNLQPRDVRFDRQHTLARDDDLTSHSVSLDWLASDDS